MFYVEREHMTMDFLFAVLNWTPFPPILFLDISALIVQVQLNELE